MTTALSDEFVTFLGQFPWKLIGTFTHSRRISSAGAIARWKHFLAEITLHSSSPIGWARFDQAQHFSGCGRPGISLHHHALLACSSILSAELCQKTWKRCAGDALVAPYDPSHDYIRYCLKMMDWPDSDWDCDGLEEFKSPPKRSK